MKYHPKRHRRHSIRLKGYDYAQEGLYFVTLCTKNRIHFFGEVENGVMQLSPFGEIARQAWEKIPERWPHVTLGAFQIMPDHMHGILMIGRPYSAVMAVGDAAFELSTRDNSTDLHARHSKDHEADAVRAPLVGAPPLVGLSTPTFPPEIPFSKIQWNTRPDLGQVIGAYISIVATECLKYHKRHQPDVWLDKIWQRGYYEIIIRDARMFRNVTRYIINNPKKWKEDRLKEGEYHLGTTDTEGH